MSAEIRYERDLVHVYMVLPAGRLCAGYREEMILGNRIPGFLPVQKRCRDGEEEYYSELLRQLVFTLCCLPDALYGYLLTEDSLFLRPETIFYQEEQGRFLLCLYPTERQDVRGDLKELLKYLMGKADPAEEACGRLCYELYGLLQKENFCLPEFYGVLEENPSKPPVKEPEKKKRDKQLFAGRRNGGIIKPARRQA